MDFDYTYKDLVAVFKKAELKEGDIVLMYSDIASIGLSREFAENKKHPSELIL